MNISRFVNDRSKFSMYKKCEWLQTTTVIAEKQERRSCDKDVGLLIEVKPVAGRLWVLKYNGFKFLSWHNGTTSYIVNILW